MHKRFLIGLYIAIMVTPVLANSLPPYFFKNSPESVIKANNELNKKYTDYTGTWEGKCTSSDNTHFPNLKVTIKNNAHYFEWSHIGGLESYRIGKFIQTEQDSDDEAATVFNAVAEWGDHGDMNLYQSAIMLAKNNNSPEKGPSLRRDIYTWNFNLVGNNQLKISYDGYVVTSESKMMNIHFSCLLNKSNFSDKLF